MEGLTQKTLGSGISRLPRRKTESLSFQLPRAASEIYPDLNFVSGFFPCEPAIQIVRLPNRCADNFSRRVDFRFQTLVGYRRIGVFWSINHRLPAKFGQVFRHFQPAHHPATSTWGPVVCDDEYSLHAVYFLMWLWLRSATSRVTVAERSRSHFVFHFRISNKVLKLTCSEIILRKLSIATLSCSIVSR